ncbi:MAG: monovalent cation/H(+) antiporter subunit G [Cyanobacteriota bacterium]|nr:monovalent cation/H(+) antiporter subunit G [Cyanobacteriota bacterium]
MNLQLLSSHLLISIGLILWFWGTTPLLNKSHNLFYKLHMLTVSDTVGSVLIISGLLVFAPNQWPILFVVTVSFVLWNTIFSYLFAVLANR